VIGWAQLRDAARAAPARPDLDRVAATLSGRRWKLGDVGRRVSWPSADLLRAALAAARQRLNDDNLARLTDVMERPIRAYVLRAEDGSERYALLGSWEGRKLGWAEVIIRRDQLEGDAIELSFINLPPDAPALSDELNTLYSLVDPRHRPRTDPSRRKLDRALWVGGSVGEAGDENWQHAISALFASRGLDVEIFVRPGDARLDHALRVVERFRGAMTVIWSPRAGDRERRRRLEEATKGAPVVLYENDLDLALVEAANCSARWNGRWFGNNIPPEPTRILSVPSAMWPIRTSGAVLATPPIAWCSATQKR
jgi:hypothetical protein